MFFNNEYDHLQHSSDVEHQRQRHPDQHFFCSECRADVGLDSERYTNSCKAESQILRALPPDGADYACWEVEDQEEEGLENVVMESVFVPCSYRESHTINQGMRAPPGSYVAVGIFITCGFF